MLRTRNVTAILAGALVLTAAATPVLFQEPPMPQPTEEHELIQKGVGEWEGTITMMMPGMPEMKSRATETVEAHGPFWAISTFNSEFMGMPYSGHGNHGFDPGKGKYLGTWIDNMSPTLSIMEGEYDDESKMIVMHWEGPDMTGKVVPHRSERKATGDAYTMSFYTDGVKNMVIDMKRKGARASEAGAGR